MHLKRHLRTAALILISGASLVVAFYVVGIDTVLSALSGIRLNAILLAGLLVLANAGIAFLRFRSVLHSFGYRPTWRQSAFAFTIGQVSNQFLFNIIGQSLSRAAALNSAGVPFSVSVMATYWERLVAAGLLLLLSLAGAFVIFIDVRLDLQGGGAYLVSLTGGILLVGTVVGITLVRSRDIGIDLSSALRFLLRLSPSIALTLAAHGAMLAAYAVVLTGLQVPEIGMQAISALVIVMFAASLPISFSGWGVRELSAAQALGAVGIDPTVAIAGAVLIGLLGLMTTALSAAIGLYLYFHSRVSTAPTTPAPASSLNAERWSDIAVLAAAVISAVLLFFQIRVPLPRGEITANAADLLALTGLGLLFFFLWTKRSTGPVPAWFFGGLVAISLLFLFGLGLGYFRFGSNSWAIMNRGLGWTIILGYVVLGASAAMAATASSLRLVLGVFALAGVTVATQQLVLLLLALFGANIPSDAFAVPLRGYANNSNAFAFQLVMAAACVITAGRIGWFAKAWLHNAAMVILSLAIFYTHSRSGLGMLAILLILTLTFSLPQQRRKSTMTVMAVSSAIIVAFILPDIVVLINTGVAFVHVALSPLFSEVAGGGFSLAPNIRPFLSITVERTSSDSERWLSIIEGWDLWLRHPLLGAGLGGYVEERISAGRDFLIIHSIPVWLMAEMGLVGLLTASIMLALLVNNAFQMMTQPERHGWGIGLLIILACMTAAGLVHDFFFQRSFWFLLGLYVAAGFRPDGPQEGRSGQV